MKAERTGPGRPLASERTEGGAGMDPEEIDRILVERARRLAKPVTGAAASGRDHLHFDVAGVRFALAIHAARRIVQPRFVTRIPCAPAHLRYVIHVDGRIVSLLDLAAFLGLERTGEERSDRIALLLEGSGGTLGVLVDALAGVRRVTGETLTADEGRASGHRQFIRGTTPDLVVVIDGERLVAEVRSESEALSATGGGAT